MCFCVLVKSQSNLLQVITTLHPPGDFAALLNSWQEQGNQDRNNRDHNKKFDQREAGHTMMDSGHLRPRHRQRCPTPLQTVSLTGQLRSTTFTFHCGVWNNSTGSVSERSLPVKLHAPSHCSKRRKNTQNRQIQTVISNNPIRTRPNCSLNHCSGSKLGRCERC